MRLFGDEREEGSGSQAVGCETFEVTSQLSCMSDICIRTHNSSRIITIKQQENNCMLGDPHNMRNCITESQL